MDTMTSMVVVISQANSDGEGPGENVLQEILYKTINNCQNY